MVAEIKLDQMWTHVLLMAVDEGYKYWKTVEAQVDNKEEVD